MLAVGSLYVTFIVLKCVPSSPAFSRTLLSRYTRFCKRPFLHLLEWSCDFVFRSMNVVYCIYWLGCVEPSLHFRYNTYLVMAYNLFDICICCLEVFYCVFLSLYSSRIFAYSLLFFFLAESFLLLFQPPHFVWSSLGCCFLVSFWWFGGNLEIDLFSFFLLNGVQVLKILLHSFLNFFDVYCNVSLFISVNFGSSLFCVSTNFIYFLKETALRFVDSLHCFPLFLFCWFLLWYYFLPPTGFGFILLLFFFQFLKMLY